MRKDTATEDALVLVSLAVRREPCLGRGPWLGRAPSLRSRPFFPPAERSFGVLWAARHSTAGVILLDHPCVSDTACRSAIRWRFPLLTHILININTRIRLRISPLPRFPTSPLPRFHTSPPLRFPTSPPPAASGFQLPIRWHSLEGSAHTLRVEPQGWRSGFSSLDARYRSLGSTPTVAEHFVQRISRGRSAQCLGGSQMISPEEDTGDQVKILADN
jgi:hypothetical protein